MREPIYKCQKYQNLKEMLKITGEKYGDRPAYIFKTEEPEKFTYILTKNLETILIILVQNYWTWD